MTEIRSLERRRDHIERILARRDAHVEAIDWSAMTQMDRENALHWGPMEMYLELLHVDERLEALTPWIWTDD